MKTKIARLAFSAALMTSLTLPAIAFGDARSDCEKRLDADRARIDRDSAKHGERSPEVDKDVSHMENDRAWCRDHHADWDHSKFDVGIYIKH